MAAQAVTWGPVAPVVFNGTVAAGQRRVFWSQRFPQSITLEGVRVEFARNTQRTLRVRLWVATDVTERQLSGVQFMPANGLDLLGYRGATNYLVGDGPEGSQVVNVGRVFGQGSYLALDVENTDASDHTFDVTFDVKEALRG